jgi:hypothetical protein
MRLSMRFVVSLTALSLVACFGGDDEEATAPVPVEQRFLTVADAPGTKPDPVETRETAEDLDEFIAALGPHLFVDLDEEETTTVLQEAGFTWAAVDPRFFGETHKRTAPHLFGAIIELQSEDGARSVLDVLEADSMKPCPMSCATQISSFDVDDIPDGRGVHRLATAQLIKTAGTDDQHPFDSYWVGFTEGSIVYAVELQGRPGSVSEEQAQKIAGAYYDRLAGN